MLHYSLFPSPIGNLLIVADDIGLVQLQIYANTPPIHPSWHRDDNRLTPARQQIEAYLTGNRTSFNLPLHLIGTEFQLKVWNALRAIPFGEVRTYQQIAADINQPTAARAVGMANHRNPLPIIIPCHRVIGSNGKLVGYAYGTEIKRWLLKRENAKCTIIGEN